MDVYKGIIQHAKLRTVLSVFSSAPFFDQIKREPKQNVSLLLSFRLFDDHIFHVAFCYLILQTY